MFAKSIKLFLLDGIPNGRITCELSNWVGKAYKIPRTVVKDSSDRKELNGVGIYFLFGKDPQDPDKDMVYIGETEGIYDRLKQHIEKKDFWNEAIAVISKDDNLNRAHIRYLEYKLFDIASKVGRFKLENPKTPVCPAISESDVAEMDEFIFNLRILVNVLGYKVFEELKQTPVSERNDTFIIRAARGADAIGQPTSEGFVVSEQSFMANDTVASVQKWIIDLRQKLISDKVVVKTDDKLVFAKDYLFSSPSAAAAVVMGRNANGLTEWKLADGTTLKDFES
jgi:hypothetical protein